MLAKAGEHGLLRSASLASPERILIARQHLLQFEVCVLGLKPVIARVRLQCLTNPSIRWRVASLILYARYAGISPGGMPHLKKRSRQQPGMSTGMFTSNGDHTSVLRLA
jgi:hypothetical protein